MSELNSQSLADLDDRDWALVDQTLRRFEALWQSTPCPSFESFVPPPDEPLRLRVLVELVKVDQEFRWESGDRQLLEVYLERWTELGTQSGVVAELLRAECLSRAILDDLPTREELHDRYPEVAHQIDLSAVEAQARHERLTGDARIEQTATSDGSTHDPVRGSSVLGHRPRLRRGQTFGRYEIRELLGEGAMGTVYRAYDPKLDREVALKIPQFAERRVVDRFVREARAAAKIRHPNICPIYDVDQVDGIFYIAMARIDGQSLAHRMTSRLFEPAEAAELVEKLARALEHVHATGIVHRDIKPSNVMLDTEAEPLLTDFGLACHSRDPADPLAEAMSASASDSRVDESRTDSLRGTPAYMSPEQVRREELDARSDVYSLGVLLYQLLTGQLPFGGPLDKCLTDIVESEPPRPRDLRPDLPAALETVCLKALAKDRDDRYPTAGAMADDLHACLRPRPRRRRSRLVGVVIVLLLLFSATLLYLKTTGGVLELVVPPNATVRIDGDEIDVPSRRVVAPVSVGEHDIVVHVDDTEVLRDSFSIRTRGDVVKRAVVSPYGWWRRRCDLAGTFSYPFPSRRRTSDQLESAGWAPERVEHPVRYAVTGDINGDGFVEVVLRDGDYVTAFDRWGGQLWRGNPMVDSGVEVPQRRVAHVSELELADLDQDGALEVVVLAGSRVSEGWTHRANQRLLVYEGDGSLFVNHPVVEGAGHPQGCFDYDRDGRVDVLFASVAYRHPHTFCIHDVLSGRRLFRADVADSPEIGGIGDVDGDGQAEMLLLQAFGCGVDPPVADYDAEHCYAMLFDSRGRRLWKSVYSGGISACVADLVGDHTSEILLVHGQDDYVQYSRLDHESGQPVRSFKQVRGTNHKRWTVADVTGDRGKELVVGDGRQLLVLDADLQLVTSQPAPDARVMAANDLNGDGRVEIVVGQGREVAIFRGDLSELARHRMAGPIVDAIVTDIDGDGINDVILRAGKAFEVSIEAIRFAPAAPDDGGVDLLQPTKVAGLFLTALRNDDMSTALAHVRPETRELVRGQLWEQTMPVIPQGVRLIRSVHVNEAQITVDTTHPRLRLAMRFVENRWWVHHVSWDARNE